MARRVLDAETVRFVWNCHDTQFWRRLEELRRFKDTQGHLVVPEGEDTWRSLHAWTLKVRHQRNMGSLSEADRVNALRDLGFEFNPRAALWAQRLRELRAIGERRPSGNLQGLNARGECDPQLQRWVYTQRLRHARGTLVPDRVAALKDLEFSFSHDEDDKADEAA